MRILRFLFALLAVPAVALSRPALPPPPDSPATELPPPPRPAAAPRVVVERVQDISARDSTRLHLNDYVELTVRDLNRALRQPPGHSAHDLRLYVDNIMVPLAPAAVDTMRFANKGIVRFQLRRNDTTEQVWQLFYRVPGKYEHPSKINIGYPTGQLGQPYPASSTLTLVLIRPSWLWMGIGLLALLLGVFVWLVRNSNLIRTDLSDGLRSGPISRARYAHKPYSLSKSHVAYWSLLILAGYEMIFFVTSELPDIPTSLLGLLGISLTNGWVNGLLNRSNPLHPNNALAPGAPAVRTLPRSRGWVLDVLTDANGGISIARLQFVVFNALVGLYVLRQVVLHWSLPDLSANILVLISISSLGFQASQQTEQPDPADADSPATSAPSATSTPPPANTLISVPPATPATVSLNDTPTAPTPTTSAPPVSPTTPVGAAAPPATVPPGPPATGDVVG